ncbi:hypothetical protein GCM10027586_01960 [Kineococcus gypseus]|uniref:ATPase, T2SS/T4P/T4SS family n=1 Tax=Kineococcus gypseus TaxID=1637102 RepID=UPI003D7CE4D3
MPDLDNADPAHPSLDDALERLTTAPTARRSRARAGQRPGLPGTPAGTDPSFIGATPSATQPVPGDDVPTSATGGAGERNPLRDDINWDLVTMLRQQAAERLTVRELARPELDQGAREEMGRSVIAEVLREHADSAIGVGDNFTPDQEQQVAKALFDMLYRAGRLQPLLDIPGVENIRIQGCDNVMVRVSGSQWQLAPPVARSDQELIETLQFLATRSGQSERAFTAASPHLHMVLPGGARLAANSWTTPRPVVTIRIHRHVDVDLDDLVGLGMLDEAIAQFLRACVSARKSIMVAGDQSAGKALALDTEVPTPAGWTTMGALNAGDQVFAEDGTPCTVLAAHDVQLQRECYEVVFDDGTSVTADGDHLWRVSRRTARIAAYKKTLKGPSHYVDEVERARLWAFAERAAAEPDRQVTVSEFCAEVGAAHREIAHREALRMGPGGHTYVSWVRHDGRRGGRPMHTYSRQALAKALAVARDTPTRGRVPRPETQVLTTRQMLEAGVWSHGESTWRTRDFVIDLSGPVQYAPTAQPVDAYVLGIWLGDGATSGARITTADPEVLDELAQAGYAHAKVARSKYDYSIAGNLHSRLRALHLLGDKHIPTVYLRGSVEQRLALLQGLMDSDGTATKSGACEFASTLRILAEQTHELVCSLGYKAHLRSKPVIWKGQPTGTCWTVSWTTTNPMFRLPRKLERQERRKSAGPRARAIVDIRPVASVPVRCITVDSPSSLFLITRAFVPTHNTTLLRALANELDPWESIATIETEYELFLHLSPERHRLILAMEARPGTGERQADGTRSGEVTLTDHLESSLRHSLNRIIVGECRGPEVGPMLQAMQAGAGAMSTVHAVSAEKTVQRLVTMLANYMPGATPNFALLQIASSIDVIVQLRVMPTRTGGGYRYVSEVIQLNGLADGATGMADTTHVFAPGEDRRALPAHQPTWLSDLEDVGFDAGWLTPGVGYWPELEPLLGFEGELDDADDRDEVASEQYEHAPAAGGAR